MKILVTGSTGFLGPSVVERLLVHGAHELRCLVRPGGDCARLDMLANRYPNARIERFAGSLATRESAAHAIKDVDMIFHLTADVNGASVDPCSKIVVASKNLLEAIVSRRAVKVVLASSFDVYCTSGFTRNATINEETPLEPFTTRQDPYSFAKLRQETLVWEYSRKYDFPLVVVRPGVIYGPVGSEITNRVGLTLPGSFLKVAGCNLLPLSYVENCAEAIVVAGFHNDAEGEAYNVHDDDLPTCKEYYRRYRKNMRHLHPPSLLDRTTMSFSKMIDNYHARFSNHLPAILASCKTAAMGKGARFDNSKLKSLGWRQLVSTDEGLRRTFDYLRANQH